MSRVFLRYSISPLHRVCQSGRAWHEAVAQSLGWDVLPEEIREYDREAVRNIQNLMEASGGWIVRTL